MFAESTQFDVDKDAVLEALGQLKKKKILKEEEKKVEEAKVLYRKSNFEPWSESVIVLSREAISLPTASVDIKLSQIRCLWHNCQFKFWRRGSSRSFIIQTFDQVVYYFKAQTVRESGLLRARIVKQLQKSCADRLLSVSSYPMPTLSVLRVKVKCKKCSDWSVSYGGYCEIHRRNIVNTHANPQNNWVLDDASPSCQVCGALFTMIRRRHHCRRCGVLLCHRCSAYFEDDKGMTRRLCRDCGESAETPDFKNSTKEEKKQQLLQLRDRDSDNNNDKKNNPSNQNLNQTKTKKSIIVRLPVPENAKPGQIMEVSHVGRRFHVRVPQDAATRGTGTFPAQFPKHPLLRSKHVVLLGQNDKEKNSPVRPKKRVSRSMDSSDPEHKVSRSLGKSSFRQSMSSYELESKEWWAKEDRIAREKRFSNYFSKLMKCGLRVVKHGRDGRRQYRCLWILSNERVCVTNNSPSYYKNKQTMRRCKGVNFDGIVRIQQGALTPVFERTFGRDGGATEVQSERCFSILLDDRSSDRRKITSTLKKLLSASQISRKSLDIEIACVDKQTGCLSQRRSELLCRWVVRMLSCHVGLCASPDMTWTKREITELEETICGLLKLTAPKSIQTKRMSSVTTPPRQRISTSAPDVFYK